MCVHDWSRNDKIIKKYFHRNILYECRVSGPQEDDCGNQLLNEYVKHWLVLAELAVQGSISAGSDTFSIENQIPLNTAVHYHLPIILI